MQEWKRSFVERLSQAQTHWMRRFEDTLDGSVMPVFEDLAEFVRSHGFKITTPLREDGRRSFKFELAENTYLLVIFRFNAVGELELRRECFVPGCEPNLSKSTIRLVDVKQDWAREVFQDALDAFVDVLAGRSAQMRCEELVAA